MSEEESVSVVDESQQAVAQAAESNDIDKREVEAQKARDNQAYNWAEANRKMKDLERQNREMQEEVLKLKKPTPNPIEDELAKLADDDIVTKSQAKKLGEKVAHEVAERIFREREAATVDERLQNKFPDFNEIVSKENIELLKQTEPELAFSLSHNPDPFAQGVAAYKLLKKIGMGSNSAMNADKEKAVKNAQKPVSVNAVTKTSALGNAHLFENGLTSDLKKQLWSEMQQAMKGA